MDATDNEENMRQEIQNKADSIKAFLEEHNCRDAVIIPLEEGAFTDCFIIATVTSVGHLKGVVHQIWGLLNDLGLSVNNRHKTPGEDGWELIDCNDIVIHLMSSELREFYSLEKLWKASER